MDLIIRAIIAIFEAIFEEDAKKRRPTQRQPQARGKPQTLEEYKAELRRQEQAARRQQVQKPKPAAQTQAPARSELPPQIPEPYAMNEITRHPADHSFLVHFDPDSIHHPSEVTKVQAKPFTIPGQTETQKLIWAQTVLGPCKAHQRMGVSRRT